MLAGEGRAEPQTGTAASRAALCMLLFPCCMHPIPAAGAGMQGTVRVRVPAVMLELCCIHTGINWAKRSFMAHKFSLLFWAREESREQREEPGGQDKTSRNCLCAGWGLLAVHAASCYLPLPRSNK